MIAATVYKGKKNNKDGEEEWSLHIIECLSLLKHSAISFLSRQQTPIGYSLYQSLVPN